MAQGIDRRTGKPINGWPYTLQCLETIASTHIGTRVMREYVGSVNPGLLARENLTEAALDRWAYFLILSWRLWVPMFDTRSWQYVSGADEITGGFGLTFHGDHKPNAHLGDYATVEARQFRADLSAQSVRLFTQ